MNKNPKKKFQMRFAKETLFCDKSDVSLIQEVELVKMLKEEEAITEMEAITLADIGRNK